MSVKDLTNEELIEYFEDAVRDNNYNPTSKNYNNSGFTYDELRYEIFSRLRQ